MLSIVESHLLASDESRPGIFILITLEGLDVSRMELVYASVFCSVMVQVILLALTYPDGEIWILIYPVFLSVLLTFVPYLYYGARLVIALRCAVGLQLLCVQLLRLRTDARNWVQMAGKDGLVLLLVVSCLASVVYVWCHMLQQYYTATTSLSSLSGVIEPKYGYAAACSCA